ncbi:acetyl-CoA carboxylase biotin carboxyl carrier protein [Deinococcus peraridilitoris]|uniref:Biotin carboxyl carrier protein of acetyl-CoA carboxylase n=1 Tax=Deinococcus peraridilitoris (strain DSM 19664 / LMG 22246 / CIP 109416 / KR-200) TaxID=937777 RepID=K9ZVW5_DEIPD|nr:acetyl-CoA carboxylase biotin carboxyl carrier protein [Deinococcus peraridilitoris]AFZ65768.1 acetyl-CoA carboxylase, biotin carboxyl carrier protein [Deinococcus peraridilitoris DSM 19664]
MDPRDLKRILDALIAADVREFGLKTGEYELNVKRGPDGAPVVYGVPAPVQAPVSAPVSAPVAAPVPTPVSVPTANAEASAVPAAAASGTPVKAPIVGTFYAASSPEMPPFVKVGDRVEVGQVLCIIEAMKLMNEIESETAGTVKQILVKNAEPVEYGQTLFVIE